MRIRTQRQSRRGVSLVETAVSMGVFLMIFFGILEYGRFLLVRHVMENAAREGARYAIVSVPANVTDANIKARTQGFMGGLHNQLENFDPATSILVYKADLATGTNTGAWNTANFGEGIAVEVTGVYRPVLPITFGYTFPIRTRSIMRSEAN